MVSNKQIPEGYFFPEMKYVIKFMGRVLSYGIVYCSPAQPHMSSLQILSVIVCMIVLFPSRLVHVYSASYIHNMILMILAIVLGVLWWVASGRLSSLTKPRPWTRVHRDDEVKHGKGALKVAALISKKKHNSRVLRPKIVRVNCYEPNEHFEQQIKSNELVGSFPPYID
jgi:hypothetical protein